MNSSNKLTFGEVLTTSISDGTGKRNFCNEFSQLIFRRVVEVTKKEEDRIETVFFAGQKELLEYPKLYKNGYDQTPSFTEKEYNQNVEERYRNFSFVTSHLTIRDNDRFKGESIKGRKMEYGVHQLHDPSVKNMYELVRTETYVPPREKDLICGKIKRNEDGDLYYDVWFICSEQFLYAWTSIMYHRHPSFSKRTRTFEPDETSIRKMLMTGNRLCTASYKKWLLSIDHEPPKYEIDQRYYRLRTEPSSKNFVHIYAALVLVLRYRELPNDTNFPVNLKGPVVKGWDLPMGWVERFTM